MPVNTAICMDIGKLEPDADTLLHSMGHERSARARLLRAGILYCGLGNVKADPGYAAGVMSASLSSCMND